MHLWKGVLKLFLKRTFLLFFRLASPPGHLNNVLSYLVPDQQITGEIKVLGSELDLNEWISDSSGDTGDSYFRKDRIELIVTADIESIKYLDYDINSLKTVAIVQENNVQINEAKASVNGSSSVI